jgi:ADP-heptose:LPS heptosyltransferase
MYRGGKQVVSSDEHNFVLNHGALGDVITSLPPIAFARKMYPTMKFKLWVPPWQMELLKHLLAPYGEFEFADLTKVPKSRKERQAISDAPWSLNTAVNATHTRCRVNMVDYAYNFLINAMPENMEQRSYLTKAPLGERRFPGTKYVVFPVGSTSENKLFRASVMGPVMRWCQEQGYATVLVGTKTSHTQLEVNGELRPLVIREQTDLLPLELFQKCIDLREKTTLLELRDLLGHAQAVIGTDGGTLHLAGTTEVPIVYGLGAAHPRHRLVVRHGNSEYRVRYVIPRDLECAGCQSNWPLITHNFNECVYGDSLCMELLSPDDFITGLKELDL